MVFFSFTKRLANRLWQNCTFHLAGRLCGWITKGRIDSLSKLSSYFFLFVLMCNFQCVSLVDCNCKVVLAYEEMIFFSAFNFYWWWRCRFWFSKIVLVVYWVIFINWIFQILVFLYCSCIGFQNCVSCFRNSSLNILFLFCYNRFFFLVCLFELMCPFVCLCGVIARSYLRFELNRMVNNHHPKSLDIRFRMMVAKTRG